MVSTDGTSVTPDGPDDARGNMPTEKTESTSVSTREKVEPAGPSLAPAPDSNGGGDPPVVESPQQDASPNPDRSEKKKTKKKKLPRKQQKINKLVMEFQPDAVEMEHRKVAGGLRWTLYVVILLLASVITWACWAQVDRVVTAEGKLISRETFLIVPTSASPIRSIEVGFGDTVKKGAPLVVLDPTIQDADVSKLETRANSLLAKLTRLEAEQGKTDFDISGNENDVVWATERRAFIDRQNDLNAILERFDAEHRQLIAQRDKNIAEIKSLTNRVKYRKQLLTQVEKLREGGTGTLNEVINNRIELDYANNLLITAESTKTETAAQFDVLEKRRESAVAERQATTSLELAETRQLYNEVFEDLNKARRAAELVILYAPDDYDEYKVVEISDRSTSARPGQPIMRLIPANVPLEVEVKVQSKDIAIIRESVEGKSKSVRVKLSAFPYTKHGTLDGIVETINEDVTEEGQPGMTRAFYYVRVKLLDTSELRGVPDNHRLRPGMSATAEIVVGRRRVIDYFIYPLIRSVDSSIREP